MIECPKEKEMCNRMQQIANEATVKSIQVHGWHDSSDEHVCMNTKIQTK